MRHAIPRRCCKTTHFLEKRPISSGLILIKSICHLAQQVATDVPAVHITLITEVIDVPGSSSQACKKAIIVPQIPTSTPSSQILFSLSFLLAKLGSIVCRISDRLSLCQRNHRLIQLQFAGPCIKLPRTWIGPSDKVLERPR